MNMHVKPPAASVEAPAWPYSADAEQIRLRCEALIPLMRERALDNENHRGIDLDLVEKLREAGAFTIATPRKWGGYALMPSEQGRIIQTVGRGDPGIAWNIQLGALHAQAVTRGSPELQEEVFSARRGPTFAGGGPLPGSTARKVDGGWMVKGRWNYASTSEHAGWLMGGAIVDAPDGSKFPLAFLLPKQEEWLLDNWDVMGLSSSNSQSFEIKEEVFVPDHRAGPMPQLLAGPPPLPLAEEEPLYGVPMPVFAQVGGMANALGAYEGLFEIWHEATRTRPTMHPDFRTQAENPITHMKAGGYRAFLAAAQAVLDKIGAFADDLAVTRRTPTPGEMEELGAMFTYTLFEVADKALDMFRDSSTSAIFRTHPSQRVLRDIITMNMHGAANRDRNFESFGRYLYGLPPMGFIIPSPDKAKGAAARP